MNQKQRTKLELIRIEGIWRMLLKKAKDEAQLTIWLDNVTETSTKDAKQAIKRLSRHQLIKIIELAGKLITDQDIDEAYEQYRYGLKPGFTLYNIQESKKVSPSVAYKSMRTYLSEIPYPDGVRIKSIVLKSHSQIDSSVIEFAFCYHIKYTYLSENEEPSFVYEHKECFAWIDRDCGFLVIQNAPDKVTNTIKKAFIAAYSASMTSIRYTDKIVAEIFGKEDIKRGTFINPNASDQQAEKLTIADSNFSKIQAIQKSVSGYSTSNLLLRQSVGENQENSLGINCNKGKIHLTANVSSTDFRSWSIEKIKMIIEYLNSNLNYESFDLFQAKNLTDLPAWDTYKAKQKKTIEKILYAVYVSHLNHQDSSDFDYSTQDIHLTMKEHFYERLSAYCDICEEPFIPLCNCGGSLNISKQGNLRCLECDQEIRSVKCDSGHTVYIDGANALVLFPNATMNEDIKQTLKTAFNISIEGLFQINNNRVTLISEKNGYLVLPGSIPEFKTVLDLAVTNAEQADLLKTVESIKEKCTSSKNITCNACDISIPRLCIMKLFTTFPGYRPSPHQASEFGDMSFTVTLEGKQCQLVGIAKKINRKGYVNPM